LAELREERDRQLADLRTEREAERQTLRVSLEALKQALDSERQHKAELRQELDLARRPWWRKLRRVA
jgi:predicted  nucleic acid-binding Zn-ribbon protein